MVRILHTVPVIRFSGSPKFSRACRLTPPTPVAPQMLPGTPFLLSGVCEMRCAYHTIQYRTCYGSKRLAGVSILPNMGKPIVSPSAACSCSRRRCFVGNTYVLCLHRERWAIDSTGLEAARKHRKSLYIYMWSLLTLSPRLYTVSFAPVDFWDILHWDNLDGLSRQTNALHHISGPAVSYILLASASKQHILWGSSLRRNQTPRVSCLLQAVLHMPSERAGDEDLRHGVGYLLLNGWKSISLVFDIANLGQDEASSIRRDDD